MMQAILNGIEASVLCGSAGIGRQAGLRCLCSTIDVRVQVPSPAPKEQTGGYHASGLFFCCVEFWRSFNKWAAPKRLSALRSGWLIAFALYYTVLTALRASLVNYVRRHEIKRNLRAEYRRYRLVGILLLSLNVVLSGILSRMIAYNDAYDYPGILIYAMAAYTFYAVILSVIALVRFRRHGSPILSAIKVVNLTAALVALLSLEATMLQRFGEPDDAVFRGTMIGISGLAASLILLSMSITMIVHASRKLKQMGENNNE